MSEETTNVSEKRILKSLKYLVLTVAVLIGATGVSNANPFTVTAEIGCDTSDPTLDNPGTIDTIDVAAGSTLLFGEVVPNQEESIVFEVNGSNRTACDETTDRGVEAISIDYTDILSMSDTCAVEPGCNTASTLLTVFVQFPNLQGSYTETITFSIGP